MITTINEFKKTGLKKIKGNYYINDYKKTVDTFKNHLFDSTTLVDIKKELKQMDKDVAKEDKEYWIQAEFEIDGKKYSYENGKIEEVTNESSKQLLEYSKTGGNEPVNPLDFGNETLYHQINWGGIETKYNEWLKNTLNTPEGGYDNAFKFIMSEVEKYKMLD